MTNNKCQNQYKCGINVKEVVLLTYVQLYRQCKALVHTDTKYTVNTM